VFLHCRLCYASAFPASVSSNRETLSAWSVACAAPLFLHKALEQGRAHGQTGDRWREEWVREGIAPRIGIASVWGLGCEGRERLYQACQCQMTHRFFHGMQSLSKGFAAMV